MTTMKKQLIEAVKAAKSCALPTDNTKLAIKALELFIDNPTEENLSPLEDLCRVLYVESEAVTLTASALNLATEMGLNSCENNE